MPPTPAPPLEPRPGDRIAKLLARAGIASRREIERMIAEGRVALDGKVLETPATVLTSLKGVTVDGQPVAAAEPARLFAFNKPSGLITAERDPAGRPTIYTALRNAMPAGSPRVMPVGRLDFTTEGLLLLTNDGGLKRALELPATGVPRTYRARVFGTVTQPMLDDLIAGVEIEGVRYGKIEADLERGAGLNRWIVLTLTEGKNREVRRVLEHLGLQVSRLIRVGYGPFNLGDLPRGSAVELLAKDVENLARSIGVEVITGPPRKPPVKAVPAKPVKHEAKVPKPDQRPWASRRADGKAAGGPKPGTRPGARSGRTSGPPRKPRAK
jgi:23S rRNA pseudouridine2605 synthase